MMMKIRKAMKCQRGFTLIELLVVISILGILAAIAVPKFSDSTAIANTAKIAADLRTIDSAIQMYALANNGTVPANGDIGTTLNAYLTSVPVPPSGNCYIGNSTAVKVPADKYQITGGRATCDGKTADQFVKK